MWLPENFKLHMWRVLHFYVDSTALYSTDSPGFPICVGLFEGLLTYLSN